VSTTTSIEWTDKTWNPVRGCALVSPGCTNCYAMKFAHRFSGDGQPYAGLTRLTGHGPVWNGHARLVPEMLNEPLHWRKAVRVFVNSMSDLFHEDLSDEDIARVYAIMARAGQHTFQVLTKRPERARAWYAWVERTLHIARHGAQPADARRVASELQPYTHSRWPLPNVWLGVSVEDQKRANERFPEIFRVPAAVYFVSLEPQLERVDLQYALRPTTPMGGRCIRCRSWLKGHWDARLYAACPVCGAEKWTQYINTAGAPGLDWVIVGGESGPGARPFALEWARSVVAQCRDARVPAFVKQIGAVPVLTEDAWRAAPTTRLIHPHKRTPDGFVALALSDSKGGSLEDFPPDLRVRQFPEARHA
jgi:protein gp37